MKKILSIFIALVIICSFSVTAFANSSTVTPDSTNKNVETEINANVSPTFTVTIPENVTLDQTATVKAENVLTEANKAVKVAITGTDKIDNTFAVTTDNASISYTIKKGDNVMKIEDYISFETDGSVALSFEKIDANKVFAGDYNGTVTFTVSYETIKN